MRASIYNLFCTLLTNLPDSHDDEGDWYPDFGWPRRTTRETEVRTLPQSFPLLERQHMAYTFGRMGFHIPPFNSVNHLHLHLHALPYHGVLKLEYPISKGRESKGFSWFVEVDQAIEILQRGKTIGVLPC